ncbi:MAG: glycosyltransferase family 2 protein [Prevotella sp.]|nr:glycosyltransferase family 2 protein [Prevotella sp.]
MKYSIITPVYNRQDCIARCIDSVIMQLAAAKEGGVEIEHVIVNDGSTDATGTICEHYAKQYPHIKYIIFPENRGTNAGRNAAINAATGDWIIILDSDDYFTDDAILTIHQTIISHPDFRHYMFAPDDRVSTYATNYLLRGRDERVLSFPDFLSGTISGDFIHVMCPDIIRKYPFDETIRIYEGVFFLCFYREAKRMLFTNKIVAIRERGRTDSVSKEYRRTSKTIIEYDIRSMELCLNRFEADFIALGLIDALCRVYTRLIDDYMMLGDYKSAARIVKKLNMQGYNMRLSRKVVYGLRIGWLFGFMLKLYYLLLKYNA